MSSAPAPPLWKRPYVRRGGVYRQHKREPLTQDEANRLANACDTALEKLVIWTLLDTGLRLREFTGLRQASIDWQSHRIIVRGKAGPYGTAAKIRPVPMSNRIRPLLEHWFALHKTIRGPRSVWHTVKIVAGRAAITRPCSPHVLRHTFAVTCIQKGISLPTVQRLLGHDQLSTTAIYLNIAPEEALAEFYRKW